MKNNINYNYYQQENEKANSLDEPTVYEIADINESYGIKNIIKGNLFKFAAISVVIFLFLMLFNKPAVNPLNNDAIVLKKSISENDFSFNFDFEVLSPGYGPLKSLSLLPWKYLSEPFRKQIIKANSFEFQGQTYPITDDNFNINWSINNNDYYGSQIEFQINSTGIHNCSVTISTKSFDLGITPSFSFQRKFSLAVKYVRREIRSLTEGDRERYFKALATMYSDTEEEGQKKYGNKFHGAAFFLYQHLNGAGTSDCDHWHDGAGVITHHTAFTLEAEQSLQAIDPSVSMPYWEYGMDEILYDNYYESPVFQNKWFGEANPTNKDHRINDGSFWGTVKLPDGEAYKEWNISKTGSLNPFVNAYGLLRSPWNNNPSPYIGRHNVTYGKTQYDTFPSCSELQSCFQSNSLADINECTNGYTHGPVHILIGGSWGDKDVLTDEVEYLKTPDKLLIFKNLWRLGFTRCPSDCTNIPKDECRCAVPDEYIKKFGAKEILSQSNLLSIFPSYFTGSHDSDEYYLKVLRAVENPGVAGEMFSSAAAYDPTFWPLHGSAERLVGYKLLMIQKGIITEFDTTWGYPEYTTSSPGTYLNGICDWSQVKSPDDLTLPNCTSGIVCPGHNLNDVLEFKNFLGKGETYTNYEFFEFISPWNDDLPYTYDTFDFDYCSKAGYDFLDSSAKSKQNEKEREAIRISKRRGGPF